MISPLFLGSAQKRAAPSGYAVEVAADSPLLWWRLNETSGTAAADTGSGGRAGTYGGGYTQGQSALGIGDIRSVLFNGSSGYVEHGGSTWAPGAQFTVEVLCGIIGQGSTEADFLNCLCSHLNLTGEFGWSLDYRYSDNKIVFYVANSGATGTDLVSASAISLSTPHLITAVQDGSNRYIYIDGILDNFINTVWGGGAYGNTAIAKRSGVSTRFLHGVIGEASIYGAALSAGRILAHATAAGF